MKILCLYLLLSCLDQLNASTWGYTDPVFAARNTSHQINRCEVARTLREPCGHQISMTESYCLSLGCCWDPTHDELENKSHCYHMTVAPSEFKPDTYVGNETFCETGTFLLGDVNADGYSDQFCFLNGNLKIRLGDLNDPYSKNSEVDVTLDECSGKRFQLGDVNGDGRSDVVCSKDGSVIVWESKDSDIYFHDYWKDELFDFCKNNQQNILSDFNGDGNADELCVSDNGRTLALGDAAGTFLAKVKDPNFDDFCTESKDKIHVGDFDADGRSDLVCQVNSGVKYQIALTDGDGFLVNEDFETVGSWCDKDDDTFLVADTNGDKHDDWVCHHGDGSVCTKYNTHIFAAAGMFANKTCDAIGWCENGDLSVGELNGDGMDDLYCRKDGKSSVATSTIKAPKVDFIQVDWNSTRDWGKKFCADKEVYPLDLNNDQREDVVCHDYKGGIIQTVLGDHYGRLVESSLWDSSKVQPDPFRFCHIDHQNPEKPTFLTGDVDDDGDTDLLCVHVLSGDLLVAKSNGDGKFNKMDVIKAGFCKGNDVKVLTADFDGNGKVDAACGSEDGWKVLMNSEGSPKVTSDQKCFDLNDEIITGKFMNGQTKELMCHNREMGDLSVLYLGKNGRLKMETLDLQLDWCLASNNEALKAGDFNGDSLTDLMCHKQNGAMKVVIHREVKRNGNRWFGQEFHTKTDFCPEIGSELTVYDANGDGYDDLTCHTSQGKITISESHIVANNGGCAGGYKRTADGACVPCGEGYYRPGNSTEESECMACSMDRGATTVTTISTSIDDCECKPGYEYLLGRTDMGCGQCGKPFYSPGGKLTACHPCENGLSSNRRGATSKTECKFCAEGHKKSGTLCIPCEKGTYKSDVSNGTMCEACPPGKSTYNTGATGSRDCKTCAAGYQKIGADCEPCAQGYYKPNPGDRCESCRPNMITEGQGATSPDQCGCKPGYIYELNPTKCQKCGEGTYSPGGKHRTCLACPNGMSTNNSIAASRSDCVSD